MTDTLPDLRVTIAESMQALTNAHETDLERWAIALRGAETLRWCAEREAPSYEEMRDQLAIAEDALEDAQLTSGEIVDNIKYAVSKWLHAETCATTLAAPIDVECSCGMAKMRQSVLDAVA